MSYTCDPLNRLTTVDYGNGAVTSYTYDPSGNRLSVLVTNTATLANADLRVLVSGSPNPVLVGNTVAYTITVTNQGPADAMGIVLTNDLSAASVVVAASVSKGIVVHATASRWVCPIGSLPAGATATLTVTVTPTAAGPLCSSASVTTLDNDPNLTDNTAQACVTVRPLDSVGDGITDAWRSLYFGGDGTTTNNRSCASCDADGTGQNNLIKYVAGLNPTNSASVFRILSVTRQITDLNVTWQTAGGYTNVLQAAHSLTGIYSNISPNIVISGSGDTTTNYLDVGGATNGASRFYRVRLVP